MARHQRALIGLLAIAAASPLSVNCEGNTTVVNSWQDVPVSVDLKYTPCFQNYSCAYLKVPLDYDNSSAGTTNIAFLKYSSPKQPAMGDIIFNPGGPGDSGIQEMVDLLPQLIGILGDSYNIVGMDPRGVNNSGPDVDCFAGSPSTRDLYINQLFDFEVRSKEAISKYYETSGGFGTWCSKALNDTARYVNTPATARDMLQYAEKLATSQGKNSKEALVNYYGISYGSTLGSTFASLYPDRVGRFIIDAVTDAEDHYFGNWTQNLLQADKSVEGFFDLCAKAGPRCALYGNGSTTAQQIKARVDRLLKAIEENPIPVTDPNFVQFPTTIVHSDIRTGIELAVYTPPVFFAILAKVMVDLEQGNGGLAAQIMGKGVAPLAACDKARPLNTARIPRWMVACNDNNKHYHHTKENLFKLFKDNEQLSKYIGLVWAPVIIPQCRNLNFTPPESQLFKGKAILQLHISPIH